MAQVVGQNARALTSGWHVAKDFAVTARDFLVCRGLRAELATSESGRVAPNFPTLSRRSDAEGRLPALPVTLAHLFHGGGLGRAKWSFKVPLATFRRRFRESRSRSGRWSRETKRDPRSSSGRPISISAKELGLTPQEGRS